jgi:predicted DNA-binding protein (MmcQ/YjbR family)
LALTYRACGKVREDVRVTRDDLVAYCLAKPGAWLDEPWEEDEVAKVGDKVFAFLGSPDSAEPSVTVKCGRTADDAEEIRRRYPEDASKSAYIGRYGWNAIRLNRAVPDDEIRELVDTSYDAVVNGLPRAKRPQ